jgi:hypothetical protein
MKCPRLHEQQGKKRGETREGMECGCRGGMECQLGKRNGRYRFCTVRFLATPKETENPCIYQSSCRFI